MTGDLTIVIINYKSLAVIEDCLATLGSSFPLVIIDNASQDGSLPILQQKYPDATFILNDNNEGFGTAINQGMEKVETEFVMLLNPDALIDSKTVGRLLDVARQDPVAGIVAPYLFSPNRGLELTIMGPHETNHGPTDVTPEGDFCTWFATAAVWLIRASALREIGGFDENIFVYAEDLDICRRLTIAGYSIIVVPDAQGTHLVSYATKHTASLRWRKEWNIVWGHLYLIKKFENAAAARRAAWRLIARHGPKVPFYLLVLDAKRFMRDLAVISGAASYLLGRKPRRTR